VLISVVVPALNEANHLQVLLPALADKASQPENMEVIIADAGHNRELTAIAHSYRAQVVSCKKANRAHQLNQGAKEASGSIIYFLHADVIPPSNFDQAIRQALKDGYRAGCFRLNFDCDHWFLMFSAWFTRLSATPLRFGDQSLFVDEGTFWQTGGFDETLHLMEDQEMVKTLKSMVPFRVIPDWVTASARRYRQNGVFKQQWSYLKVYFLYHLGYSQSRLLQMLR
jgi:rSAM/selenodomain-associated transferase 2